MSIRYLHIKDAENIISKKYFKLFHYMPIIISNHFTLYGLPQDTKYSLFGNDFTQQRDQLYPVFFYAIVPFPDPVSSITLIISLI